MNWVQIQQQLRIEINTALEILTDLLLDLGGEYAYAKGSAMKPWDSAIDYVPLVSDLDIHVYHPQGLDTLSLDQSLEFLQNYESRYCKSLPDAIHLPRMQLLDISSLYEHLDMVPPRQDQITTLFGNVNLPEMPPVHRIVEIDRSKLLGLQKVVNDLPLMLLDRTDQELWIALRRLTWRVGPTPVRLLSQIHDNPIDLWGWNRTSIIEELKRQQYDDLAGMYTKFYELSWDLFEDRFQSPRLYHQLFIVANDLFVTSLDYLKKLEK